LDIAKGMEVLHFMNPPVIHRDLKSLNVFILNKNNRWVGKVADFGLSRSPDADMMTSALGTLVNSM
jgi:serine/threonine protein kinase